MSRSLLPLAGALCAGLVLAGCAVQKPTASKQADAPAPAVAAAPEPVRCTPVRSDDPMVGTWYSVSRPRGFAGDLQALTVLSPDGRMTYETQMKVGRKTRPALRESGCWTVAEGVYTMRTTESNGDAVDAADPIYTNSYRVEKVDRSQLKLREIRGNGQVLVAKRMSPGYRLPN
ncbi:putative lipoprotein [Bordetella ansorpii]|uniref:Putative lipoprotein n=1 Tax=Bordetella ansorpii TaxID=288768 RepID=A0A157QQT7_9BORD|nr:hypothetical protein [Bordetella ansorpii]SAI47988.1 putative lipoprotein [Bordetella ansorpii]